MYYPILNLSSRLYVSMYYVMYHNDSPIFHSSLSFYPWRSSWHVPMTISPWGGFDHWPWTIPRRQRCGPAMALPPENGIYIYIHVCIYIYMCVCVFTSIYTIYIIYVYLSIYIYIDIKWCVSLYTIYIPYIYICIYGHIYLICVLQLQIILKFAC